VTSSPQPSLILDNPRNERTRWILLFALCLFSALLGRLCYLARPFDNDAAIFIYMGKMVSEGGRLCHDLIDNKFPTVGLMTSVLWRTIGMHWWMYIALQTVMSLIGAWMLGQMAARHIGSHARLPAMLFSLVYFNFTTAVFGGFQLETVQAFFSILAARSALIAIESDNPADAFLAGLCAGCGAMFKPSGLAVLGAFGFAVVIQNLTSKNCAKNAKEPRVPRRENDFSWRSWHLGVLGAKRIAILGIAAVAGVAIPLSCALAYLIQADMLRDMPGLWHQISTYANQTAWAVEDLAKPLVAVTLLGFPIAVRGWICRRQRDATTHWPATHVTVFVVVWFLAETAGVVMQRRMYAYHFLPIIPPAALLFALFPRTARPIPLAAALMPMILMSVYAAGDVIALTYNGMENLPATDYLATRTKPGDAVWTDAWPRLALETNLKPGSRYPFTFLFANYDNAGIDYARDMIDDFERTKPAYIFLPTPMDKRIEYQLNFVSELIRRPQRAKNYAAGWHMIQSYTLAHYDREIQVGGEIAYRRKSDVPQGTAAARAE
jgi:Dolichyl-phosphate-mannose-protein mannosyltransferase